MLVKIIRWLKGYVKFTGIGKFPERFINLLNINGILYWDLLPVQNGVTGVMPIYNYLRIRKFAKKSSIKLKINKKIGLPFFVNKHKNRKGILLGALCGLLIMCFLSNFVWVVDIKDVNSLSAIDVKNSVEECGLKIGAHKKSLDFSKIEREVILKNPQIGWIAINCLNNVATVEIREKAPKPKIEKTDFPCNLKASTDGIVTKTIVSNGDCKVKAGSAVAKNQILVSCVINQGEDKVYYVHSKGEIYADVTETKEFTVSKTREKIILDKNYKTKSNAYFLGASLPFEMSYNKTNSLNTYHKENMVFNNVFIPVGKIVQRNYNYCVKSTIEKDCKNILLKKIKLYEYFNYNGQQIKSKDIVFTNNKNSLKAKVKYTINKNIAQKQKVKIS